MISQAGRLGRWQTRLGEKTQCELCPRYCRLKPGQRGFCFVRRGTSDGIELTTYGRSSGFCLDPIEKKPLNHFFPGTSVLSFGTAGCNLGCKFCQNWDISKSREMDRLMSLASPEEIADAALKNGATSVACTYNDPVIFAEYAIDTASACRAQGIQAVAVTAGYITEQARGDFFECFDAVNVDLKAFTEDFYQKQSLAELKPVLETLVFLKKSEKWFEVTTLLIPGLNDSESELNKLCDWFGENLGPEVPLHFTAFHPDFKMRDRPPTPPETLTRAREIARQRGLHYVYTGNVHDPEGSSTYCPNPRCQRLLVERDWYELGEYAIRDGSCMDCGTPIPGVFRDQPGTWGAQRKAVRIGE